MEDKGPFNPFKDLTDDDVQRYLGELDDNELLDLLDTVSADLKRRNNLLPRPGKPGTRPDDIRNIVKTLFDMSEEKS